MRECPECHTIFSLIGRNPRRLYCTQRCHAQHRNRQSYQRRRMVSTPLPCVDTACLPEVGKLI